MRRFLAAVFALALVFPLILTAQASISTISFALDRDFYIQALDSQPVYDVILSERTISQLVFERLPLPPEADTKPLENFLMDILTRDYLRDQLSGFINDLFDFLQGKTGQFQPSINIVPIKNTITQERTDEFMMALIASLPVCQPGLPPGIHLEAGSACKPSAVPDDAFVAQLEDTVVPLLAFMPDEIQLAEVSPDETEWQFFLPGMAVPASAILGILFLSFVALIFWYIGALIADDSWRIRLQWLGWTLLIPAIIIFLVGLSMGNNIPSFWIRYSLERADFSGLPFPEAAGILLNAVIRAALPIIARSFMMMGGISGAFSLGFIFWGLATPRKT